ncbi:MAG: hypothetical protein LUG99_10875 [Lachnospiraceae bacterium]|nr:hypothetical protein [Lachnospiraceae bacterium]
MKKNRLAIYVSSPNSYQDIFKVYYECLKKFFSDCPYEVILTTNSQEYEGITVINNYISDDSWTDRTIPVLKTLNVEYILLMNDDTFFAKKVDVESIEAVLDEMDKNKIDFCNLSLKFPGKSVKESKYLKYIHQRQAYGILLQMGIFRRDFLIKLLGNGEKSIYDIEKELLFEALNAPNKYFDNIVSCKYDLIPSIHGVKSGKWIRYSYNKLKRLGIKIDSKRNKLSFREELNYHIRRGIGTYINPKLRLKIKMLLKRVGFKFNSDY